MRTALLSLALLGSLTACTNSGVGPASGFDANDPDSKALLGGTDAAGADFNFQVAIFRATGEVACSGIALGEDWVLTTGGCWVEAGEGLRVGTASPNVSAMIQLPVDDAVPTETGFFWPDLVLLHVATGNLLDWGRPAVLAGSTTRDDLAGPGTMATLSGWGPEEEGGVPSEALQRGDLPMLDQAVCAALGLDEHSFCAGFIGFEAVDACGDQGAPLTIEQGLDRVVLGLNTGSDCASVTEPASFRDLAPYLTWILEHVPDARIAQASAPTPDDHGDTTDDATELEQAVSFTASGELTPDDTDVFAFDVVSAQQVKLWTESAIDTIATLLDAQGAVVATNDDSGPALNFEIDAWLEPGRYHLQVQGYRGTQEGAYTLHIEGDPDVEQCLDDDQDENETPETAWPGLDNEFGTAVSGSVDYFRLNVAANELATIVDRTGWVWLSIKDATGADIDTGYALYGPEEHFPVSDTEQTYLVEVTTSETCEPFTYQVFREACTLDDDESTPNDSPTDAAFLDAFGIAQTNVLSAGDTDVWRIGTVQSGQIATARVDFVPGRGEPGVRLVDEAGNDLLAEQLSPFDADYVELSWANDTGDALNVHIETTHPANHPCAKRFDVTGNIVNP